MKKIFIRCIALCLIVTFAVSLGAIAQEKTRGEQMYDNLLELAELLKSNHINADEQDDPIKMGLIHMFDLYPHMYQTFANIMYQSYDDYSYYLDASTHTQAYDSTIYVGGIGITMIMRDDGAYVDSVVSGGTAEDAGIKAGDKLIAADGVSFDGFSVEMIGEIIRGEVGTEVSLRVLRDGKELDFKVSRFAMATSPVSAELVGDGVAYMRITSFDDVDTYLDFSMLYKDLPSYDVSTILLDLRDNPGGSINVAINIAERLIQQKGIPYLMLERTNPLRVDTYVSEGLSWDATKMVILVNENTASSAEFLAGILKELGYATVVGKTTMGKGVGQMHQQLDDNSFAVITNSKFYLPISGAYDKIGIKPDVEISLGQEYYHIPKNITSIMTDRSTYPGESSNAYALEQRLCELGYFSGKPDRIADGATFLAINRFQRDNKLAITRNFCNAATALALDRALRARDGSKIFVDTQYPSALAIAKGYAKNKTKPDVIPMNKITFGEEN